MSDSDHSDIIENTVEITRTLYLLCSNYTEFSDLTRGQRIQLILSLVHSQNYIEQLLDVLQITDEELNTAVDSLL